MPLIDSVVAATSVGLIVGEVILDLCYEEDSRAEVDMNVVMTGSGDFVEMQATAEGRPFSSEEMQVLALAAAGIRSLTSTSEPYCPRILSAPADSAAAHRQAGSVLLASGNPGKLKEYRVLALRILQVPRRAGIFSAIFRLPEFEDPRRRLQRTPRARRSTIRNTEELVFADDSGLVVPALGGAPGVLCALRRTRCDQRSADY